MSSLNYLSSIFNSVVLYHTVFSKGEKEKNHCLLIVRPRPRRIFFEV